MTKRYLWTIVGVSLCAGAAATGALAATAPGDWVCKDEKNKVGQCEPIRVLEPLPIPDPNDPNDPNGVTKVRHLARDATFLIVPGEGPNNYLVKLKSEEWHAAFLGASLTWEVGDGELLPYDYCKPDKMEELQAKQLKARAARKKLDEEDYSYFYSSSLEIHLDKNDLTKAEKHVWYIYPIAYSQQSGKYQYCLSFLRLGGASHDGAVHGEP
jgi:hypothetical protein